MLHHPHLGPRNWGVSVSQVVAHKHRSLHQAGYCGSYLFRIVVLRLGPRPVPVLDQQVVGGRAARQLQVYVRVYGILMLGGIHADGAHHKPAAAQTMG